jgi:hypothetical protein
VLVSSDCSAPDDHDLEELLEFIVNTSFLAPFSGTADDRGVVNGQTPSDCWHCRPTSQHH